jgi:protein-L-isoaspartate(D-aspartate) O-methyltransferase
VVAVEIDASLAGSARDALARSGTVEVVTRDGADIATAEVDVIHVNAAASRPAAAWLDHLADSGRLPFPLGVPTEPGARHAGAGVALLVTRRGPTFAARTLGPASFIRAEGRLGANADRARLAEAFRRGGAERITRLLWREPPAGSSSVVGEDGSLTVGS